MNPITAAQAREIFVYDSKDGSIRWRADHAKVKAGDVAGRINGRGYWQVKVNGEYYQGHRLAWLIFYGRWPIRGLDHINRIKTDNRIYNLREASHRENMENRAPGHTGIRGVTFDRGREQYRVRLNGKDLGYFRTLEEATRAMVRP